MNLFYNFSYHQQVSVINHEIYWISMPEQNRNFVSGL